MVICIPIHLNANKQLNNFIWSKICCGKMHFLLDVYVSNEINHLGIYFFL